MKEKEEDTRTQQRIFLLFLARLRAKARGFSKEQES
jgi:hypothetical protein